MLLWQHDKGVTAAYTLSTSTVVAAGLERMYLVL